MLIRTFGKKSALITIVGRIIHVQYMLCRRHTQMAGLHTEKVARGQTEGLCVVSVYGISTFQKSSRGKGHEWGEGLPQWTCRKIIETAAKYYTKRFLQINQWA